MHIKLFIHLKGDMKLCECNGYVSNSFRNSSPQTLSSLYRNVITYH